MKILSILFLFSILIACSQNRQSKVYVPNPKAKQLLDSALRVANRPDNSEKAIVLIDQAIMIDSNYFDAYYYKLFFQSRLNQLNDALITSKNMIRLKPQEYERYTMTGSLYWQLGDTISATDYYTKASILFDKIFDTMSKSNRSYDGMLMQKGFYLVMTGKQEQGNKIWNEYLNNGKFLYLKQEFGPLLNKSRREIMEELSGPDTVTSTVEPIIIK